MIMKTQDKIKSESFTEHLIELRSRLIRSMVVFVFFFILSYYFSEEIYNFLVAPLYDIYLENGIENPRMIYTALTEAFFTFLKVPSCIDTSQLPSTYHGAKIGELLFEVI